MNSTIRKLTIQFKNWKDICTNISPKMIYWPSKNIWNDAQHHIPLGDCKLKQWVRYHYTLTGMDIIQNTDIKCWQGCGPSGTLFHCWWKCKWYGHFGRVLQSLTLPNIFSLCNPAIVQVDINLHWVENLSSHTDLHRYIYRGFIHNRQNMETNSMFSNRWWVKGGIFIYWNII